MEQEIGPGGKGFLIFVAVVTDAMQAFLTFTGLGMIVTPFITVGASMALGFTFAHYGAGFYKSRNVGRFLVTFMLEFLPGLNMLPIWTISTLLGIALHNRRMRKQPKQAVYY